MSWISKEKRLAIYLRDNFTCMYCGTDMKSQSAYYLTLDHLICRVNGGTNEAENLVLACRDCNCRDKHMKDYTEFATGGALKRIEKQRKTPINIELARKIMNGSIAEEVADKELPAIA